MVNEDVTIAFDGIELPGHLSIPDGARGIVLFAHGSGSSRLSPRNVAVAKVLQGAGLGTLLFDLLSEDEADVRTNVFDIELLAERLVQATLWLRARHDVGALPLGYFGASTGAAAALVAAAQCPDEVSAVVSRGGRPDLAGEWLQKVQAPTLLVVGGHDYAVIDLNRDCPVAPALRQPAGDRGEVPRTCSRSPARSARPLAWRSRGSSRTCRSGRRRPPPCVSGRHCGGNVGIAPTVDACIVLPPRCSCSQRASPGHC